MHINQGDRTELIPTDPWDFVTVNGSGPFVGTVTAVDSTNYKAIVVRLDRPIRYEGVEAHFIKASARHVGDKFEKIGEGKVFCNITSLTDDEGEKGAITDRPSPDKRLAFIGDISWSPSLSSDSQRWSG